VSTASRWLVDGVIAVVAGMAASKVMEPVTTKLYEWQSDRGQEAGAGGGATGLPTTSRPRSRPHWPVSSSTSSRPTKPGMALHYALRSAGPVYMWLRRSTELSPWSAGLTTGTSMFLVVDEAMNPLLGFTPPPQAYPSPRTCAVWSVTSSSASPWPAPWRPAGGCSVGGRDRGCGGTVTRVGQPSPVLRWRPAGSGRETRDRCGMPEWR
jgi:hypothetical protein